MEVRRTVPVALKVDSDDAALLEVDTSEQATTENGAILGVDLDVNNLAVTSTGTFWTGDEFDHWRGEYEKRRSSLQQCGTRWAHENVQSVGRKEEGRFKSRT